jgi:aspartyl-tRNA(Asn)/glutamyl-tRNA(Gln) amidotransferase subunit A
LLTPPLFDVIGPFSKSIEDAALVMEVISGGDDFDGTATQREVPPYSQLLNKNPIKRIGYIKETVEGDGVDPEVSDQFQQQLAALQDLGYEVKPLSFPLPGCSRAYLLSHYYCRSQQQPGPL